ncbi:MAG TPA: hypothetical protein VF799_09750 [Geobacteraceae bacterium]
MTFGWLFTVVMFFSLAALGVTLALGRLAVVCGANFAAGDEMAACAGLTAGWTLLFLSAHPVEANKRTARAGNSDAKFPKDMVMHWRFTNAPLLGHDQGDFLFWRLKRS